MSQAASAVEVGYNPTFTSVIETPKPPMTGALVSQDGARFSAAVSIALSVAALVAVVYLVTRKA